MSRICLLFACLLCLAPCRAQENPEVAPVAQDIVAAGSLRTQSQRLAKLHRQAAMGIDAERARRELRAGGERVDAALARLARYAQKADTRRTYARCDSLWRELRGELERPGAAAGERVVQLADELMITSGKLALQVEAQAEMPLGRLLDLSTRLNMLGQRLARLTLQIQSGDRSQGLRLDVEQARREFATGLAELDAARENSRAARQAIALARNQWIFFDLAIAQLDPGARKDGQAARNVASSSERIAQMLDEASAQYLRDYGPGRS
ncbi:type IV pili methyl-accepting chemotaxis transducer N-terminal domain-containing protein [Azonexus fungiphilus]|uniref:type IV pili methyl-accepting chemotaxis transducer N-terminal domain-containing protein n=1 Tax=Azonexus fungiphilus TaxID=146940 RepID=UPI00156BCD79|nr:type IV pili methyl-accepting chemotaxis transducer N-terminal domain-containing protein [Azonexus fungiphilus]NHC07792.1 hypothetical protein [Azonexus fungiphilus]